LKYCISTTT